MPNIIFHNNTYTFGNENLNLQYFNSGDLHGNDNFRIQDQNPPIYEVLNRINPALLQSALAATIDNTPVPLTAKITKDCSLDIITLDDEAGKLIFHYSLAFLIAQTIYTNNPNIQLSALSVTEQECNLHFITENTVDFSTDFLKSQLKQRITDNAAIQIIDAFQKEMLLETYSSLLHPYAKNFMQIYDDYDYVTVAVRQSYVLPIPNDMILITNPLLIKDFTFHIHFTEQHFEITAQYEQK